MTQTKLGGQKAATTNKKLYGDDYYHRIGRAGGAAGTGHKFGHGRIDPRVAGALGGTKSRRGPVTFVIEGKKYQWVEDKPDAADETLFVDEAILIDEEFGAGFFRPTWRQRMFNRLRSR